MYSHQQSGAVCCLHTNSVEKLPHTASACATEEGQTLPGSQTSGQFRACSAKGSNFTALGGGKGSLGGRGYNSDEHGFRNRNTPKFQHSALEDNLYLDFILLGGREVLYYSLALNHPKVAWNSESQDRLWSSIHMYLCRDLLDPVTGGQITELVKVIWTPQVASAVCQRRLLLFFRCEIAANRKKRRKNPPPRTKTYFPMVFWDSWLIACMLNFKNHIVVIKLILF